MEAPICLIENTADDKLVVNPEAISILSKFNQPVVVVSIVGMYRTGKSYLMNKLAGAQKGFGVGSTVQAQTKGIWMWCVPHPTKANHTLVLLDTEGLGDVEKGDGKSDIRIFALALLLSSALVYNSNGTINQDSIEKLKFVGEISELIKIKSENNEDEEEEFSTHFPTFIWAVRDFYLALELDGRQISEDEYLENALRLKTPERTTRDEDYNRLRKRIRAYFGTRKCFTFGLPTSDENVLHNLDRAPESALKGKFVAQCQRFCDYIFTNVEVKRINAMVTVTGHRLGELVKIYTDAIANSKFACMEDAVGSLAEQENRAAIEEATKHYIERMKTIQLPTDTLNAFMELSRGYEDEARQMFLKRSFKDNNEEFLQKLMENLHKQKNEFVSMNEKKSREICEALIRKHSLNFEKALAGGAYNIQGGHAKFQQDLKAIEGKFKTESGKGVKAEEVLQDYMKSKQSAEICIIQQDNALTLKEKEAAEENNQRRIQEMEQNFRRQLEQQNNLRAAEVQASIQQTRNQLSTKMEEERRLMKEKMQRVIREKEQERQLYLQQGLKEQADRYQQQIGTLQREKQEAERLRREYERRTEERLRNQSNRIHKLQNRGGGCIIS